MRSMFILLILLLFVIGCSQQTQMKTENIKEQVIDRESKIPTDAIKVTPDQDTNKPKSYSDEYADPVPVSGINTAGAEDSGFIMPDGKTVYFFFTPDVRIPAEKQILDNVTGIYYSKKINNVWTKAERIKLQTNNKLALDGCEFIQNNKMLFCSAREGYNGMHWFEAEYLNGKWQNWKNADFNSSYQVGELHIINDELYFHSNQAGGRGGLDIWVSKNVNGKWQEPENLGTVNTDHDEGWPFVTQDGKELWISKDYGLWRSKLVNNEWTKPELMISPLAGEASLDNQGNVYFTHHFFKDNKMIEADIYVAVKK